MRRTCWRRAGRIEWRIGIMPHEWTIGVRYELAPDAWLITILCVVLVLARSPRSGR